MISVAMSAQAVKSDRASRLGSSLRKCCRHAMHEWGALITHVMIVYLATIILILVLVLASLLRAGPHERATANTRNFSHSNKTNITTREFYTRCAFHGDRPVEQRGNGSDSDDDGSFVLARGGGGGPGGPGDDDAPAAGGRAQLVKRVRHVRGRCASPPPVLCIMPPVAQPDESDSDMETALFGRDTPPPCTHRRVWNKGSTRTTRRCSCRDCGAVLYSCKRGGTSSGSD